MTSRLLVRATLAMVPILTIAACGEPASPPKAPAAAGGRLSYENGVRQLVEKRCHRCHGPASPTMAEFDKDKPRFKEKQMGPRYDTYESLMIVVNGSDTGALMRRLDDGTNTKDGKPGNMHEHLGDDAAARSANLAIFKRWVGGWTLKRVADITPEEKAAILAPKD